MNASITRMAQQAIMALGSLIGTLTISLFLFTSILHRSSIGAAITLLMLGLIIYPLILSFSETTGSSYKRYVLDIFTGLYAAFFLLIITYPLRKNLQVEEFATQIGKNYHELNSLFTHIVKSPSVSRAKLLIDLMRIKINRNLPWHHDAPVPFGPFNIHHPGDNVMVTCLLNEIFIDESYAFHTTKKDPIIIDCGSNIGISVLYFKYLYPDAKIIGFEPEPTSFEILNQNIEANNLKDITVHPIALCNKEGSITFFRSENAPGSTVNGIKSNGGFVRNAPTIEVKASRLSNYINGPVDFLKMDVEGAEDDIFEDLVENNKLKFIKEMVFEFHHHMTKSDDRLSTILKILEDHNFSYQIQADGAFNLSDASKFTCMLIYAYQRPTKDA